MTLTTMNRATAKKVAALAETALNEALEEMGIEVTRGHTSFGAAEMSTKFTFAVTAKQGEVKSQDSELLGFDRNIVGLVFTQGSRRFTVTDIHLRKHKFPIIAKNDNGTAYKFGAKMVARLLGDAVEFNAF